LKAEIVAAAEQIIEEALASVMENFANVNWMHGWRLLFEKCNNLLWYFEKTCVLRYVHI
jgi:hypothetical protein